MKKAYILPSVLLSSLFMLSGCDSFRNTFGLDHSSPNEWDTAEPLPDLKIPPDFNSHPKLPAPTPGAPNPHAVPTSVKVKKTVLGESDEGAMPASTSDGEQELIEKASENQEITPDIRNKVDQEAQAEDSISGKVVSKIRSWKKEATDNLTLANKKDNPAQNDDTENKDDEAGSGKNDDDQNQSKKDNASSN